MFVIQSVYAHLLRPSLIYRPVQAQAGIMFGPFYN